MGQLLDAVGEAVIVTSPEGTVLAWNRAAEILYGWSAEEALGRDIIEFTSPGPSAEAATQIMEQLRAGKPWSGEFPVRCRDETTRLVVVTNTPVLDEDGTVTALVGISRDVTESRWHESAFRRRQEQLSFAFEAVEMGSWSWDMATGVVEWDTAMESLYGLQPGEFAGTFDAYMQLVHPDDRDHTAGRIDFASEPGEDLVFEHRIEWPDGSVHWLEGRGRTLTDDDGAPVGMVGVGINIDNRKQLEEAARDAATSRATAHLVAQLEAAERIAKLGSWYWDAAENLVTLSVEMAQLLDCDDSMSGQEFRDALQRVVDPDDVALLFDAPIRMLADHTPFAIEQRMHIGDTRAS
jgi:PAS domain S-box-containing protein